jgi:hypothetical protein
MKFPPHDSQDPQAHPEPPALMSMIRPLRLPALWAAACFACLPVLPSQAGSIEPAAASALIEKHQDALVRVSLVNTIRLSLLEGPEELSDMIAQQPPQEQPLEAPAVLIHESGLVAAPLAVVDPTKVMTKISLPTPMGAITLGLNGSMSAVRILTADGREMEADLVFQDAAAGLALFKPREAPEQPLTALALAGAAVVDGTAYAPALLLSRHDATFGHAGKVSATRVAPASLTPPAVHPLVPTAGMEPGAAVFTPEAGFLGILTVPLRGEISLDGNLPIPCLLPAAEILRLGKEVMP